MARAALVVTVAFAVYAVTSSLLAVIVAMMWRKKDAPNQTDAARRAAHIVAVRIAPSALGLALTAGVIMPVFLTFEPVREYEAFGPLLIALAAVGVTVVAAATGTAVRAALLTRAG